MICPASLDRYSARRWRRGTALGGQRERGRGGRGGGGGRERGRKKKKKKKKEDYKESDKKNWNRLEGGEENLYWEGERRSEEERCKKRLHLQLENWINHSLKEPIISFSSSTTQMHKNTLLTSSSTLTETKKETEIDRVRNVYHNSISPFES